MSSWLFRKRIKALPGVFVNISRSGLGLGVGVKGANVSLGKRGIHLNTGIPGSGIYRRDKLADWKDVKNKLKSKQTPTIQKKPATITSTISKQRQIKPKVQNKNTFLTLEIGDKKRIIINNLTFGRNECRSSFNRCDEIYTRQFSFLLDKSGQWFIQGLQVPKTAKNKSGDTLKFYKTIYNEIDITNKVTKIENTGEIKIGNTKFTLNINN